MKVLRIQSRTLMITIGRLVYSSACRAGFAVLFVSAVATSVEAQNLLWAKRAGGSGSDQGNSVAVDNAGNSHVTGSFANTATFGLGEAKETTLTSSDIDIFVAKYDANGALDWAKRASGGAGLDEGLGIAVDGSGNSYVAGRFNGSATFGQGEVNATTLMSAGDDDIFVAKFSSNGTLLWARRAGGTDQDIGFGIGIDALGNSYVTGVFKGSATFGQGQANQTVLTSAGDADIFVAKYDSFGTLIWAKRAGGIGIEDSRGIAVDILGNGYLTGSFQGSATFGQGEANQTTLTSVGSADIYVTKYSSNGELLWAKRAGGSGFDVGNGIAADTVPGNSYVTGRFNGSATFGQGEANATTLTSPGSDDIFVAKYDFFGVLIWAKRAGGTSSEIGVGIALDNFANSYVTGRIFGSATFGQGETNQTTLSPVGNFDIFVAKYGSSGALQWAKRAGGTSGDRGFGIAVDSSGSSYVTGHFQSSAPFGPGEASETTLTSVGVEDFFVAKYSGGPILVACPTDSLQNAINLAAPGQSILVTGTCNENLLVRNEKQRITVDGGGTATISAPSTASPALNVRGKGILVQGFTISGGSVGVYINRGSNAVFNNNTIQNTNGNGVLIDELAFAVLTTNTIQNNPAAGVFVSEHSTARVGFNADTDTIASANTIQNNAVGVLVSNGSGARVIGNTISNNTGDGVQVLRDSHADIASNAIGSNGGDGIVVAENSLIQLGEDTGNTIYESPNSGSGNAGVGVRCATGSIVDGRLGTLTGAGGAKNVADPSCVDSLL